MYVPDPICYKKPPVAQKSFSRRAPHGACQLNFFFEMGMSVPEVALISGHKDVRQLFRYTHLNPKHVFKKYDAF